MKILASISVAAGSIFRLYMGGNAILAWVTAIHLPHSALAHSAHSSASEVLVWLLMLTGVAAVVDAIVNDFMPNRFHWRAAVTQRHFILSSMAFCYMAQLYVAFYSLGNTGLVLYYLWNASTIVFTSFVDANQRAKDAACATTQP